MVKRFIHFFIPPRQWRLAVLLILSVFTGLSVFIFIISRAPSYLSDRPEACMNCHIMAPQYATWNHSAHREWTHCNDCHVPHNNVFNKYFFKAKDGLRHAAIFTLRREPQVIFIREEGQEVVQSNCLRCHSDLLNHFRYFSGTGDHLRDFSERKCWSCHRETPHGRVSSLSSVPNARVPLPGSPVPPWLRELMKNKKSTHTRHENTQ